MPERPLIVVSLEGFARAALSCYGSSWNRTPAIDAIAAGGCVYDRLIATSDNDHTLMRAWFDPRSDWIEPWRRHGAVELITDVSEHALPAEGFDHTYRLPQRPLPPAPLEGVDDIAETAFGHIVAAAAERDSDPEPWNLLWLHSDFLTRCWDAPRGLLPGEEIDPEIESRREEGDWDGLQAEAEAALEAALPLVFDQIEPPQVELTETSHSDLVTSWMRTYGCQIRLVDLLLEVLLGSLQVDDPQLMLVGTSGFRLGQAGWIGHATVSPRSPDLQLPCIVSDCGPLRVPQLTSSDEVPEILRRLGEEQAVVEPEPWSDTDQRREPIRTHCERAAAALTTPEWFYVEELDGTPRLFLKPDDIDDFNDVARVRDDIVKEFQQRA